MPLALVGARLAHDAALTLLFGALLFPAYAWTGWGRDEAAAHKLSRRLRPILAAAAGVAFASGVAWFALTAAAMAGDPGAAFDATVLKAAAVDTDFGKLWLWRLGAALVLLLLLLPPLKAAVLRPLALLLSAGLLASLAGTGHAQMETGFPGAAHVAVDAVHLLTAGLWLGALPPLAMLMADAAASGAPERLRESHRVLDRFSAVAVLAVSALALSGVANSLWVLGSVGKLFETVYGRVLLVKIALVLGMLALAAFNRQRLTPALAGAQGAQAMRRLRRHVLVEQMLGGGVLAAVAWLGVLSPES